MKDDYTINSQYLTYTVGECTFWTWVKGLKVYSVIFTLFDAVPVVLANIEVKDFSACFLFSSVCPKGVTMLKCDPLLCSTAQCPGQKGVVCRVNPCGKCEVEFLDKFDRKVQCKCCNIISGLLPSFPVEWHLCQYQINDVRAVVSHRTGMHRFWLSQGWGSDISGLLYLGLLLFGHRLGCRNFNHLIC